jgi:hypothetical protein
MLIFPCGSSFIPNAKYCALCVGMLGPRRSRGAPRDDPSPVSRMTKCTPILGSWYLGRPRQKGRTSTADRGTQGTGRRSCSRGCGRTTKGTRCPPSQGSLFTPRKRSVARCPKRSASAGHQTGPLSLEKTAGVFSRMPRRFRVASPRPTVSSPCRTKAPESPAPLVPRSKSTGGPGYEKQKAGL